MIIHSIIRPVAFALLFASFSSPSAFAQDPSQKLNEILARTNGKVLQLRHLVSDSTIRYDSMGRLAPFSTGVVAFEAIVTKEGHVEITRITRPLGFGLEQTAADALSQWVFSPGLRDGAPVHVVLNIEVHFNLR